MSGKSVTVLILAALGILNLLATMAVVKNHSYATSRKIAQMLVIWLVPVLGAIACLVFAHSDATSIRRDKPREFFENADSGGSDH